ncbi:MAG: PEP-CTERM sorting domain-containing protein [Sedimentisphaerales bacterium]|nr:PEP-CTERM sorting domain-containing protein [Sedimentisphaerales bacterium]
MHTKRTRKMLMLLAVLAVAAPVQAAFMVEAHPSGLANGNFAYNGTSAPAGSISSTAYGVTATNSVFGGNVDPDTYTYSYTPGTNADNLPIPAGTDLGNDNLASGAVGGASTYYNVYITWPATTNVNAAGCKITVTSDGTDIVLDPVNMNTGGTGTPGGNNAWLLIGDDIKLTQGVTYTVTQKANSTAYVSQRSHGVLWEAVPEPMSLSLLGVGALLLRRRRR